MQAISQIPFSIYGARDQLVWWFSYDCNFTICSTNYLELSRVNQQTGSTFSPSPAESQRKSIWSLGVPGSVCHFLWRACHEILPTRRNLWAWKITHTDRCPICTHEAEIVIHVLWRCSTASDNWGDEVLPVKEWPTNFEDFWSLWSCMSSELLPQQLALSAMVLQNVGFGEMQPTLRTDSSLLFKSCRNQRILFWSASKPSDTYKLNM